MRLDIKIRILAAICYAMSSSASGVQSNSTSGKFGNIFDDPELVSSIMRMPSFPAQGTMADPRGAMFLDGIMPADLLGQVQDTAAGISGRALHKPESGDQSYLLEEETDLGERLACVLHRYEKGHCLTCMD